VTTLLTIIKMMETS